MTKAFGGIGYRAAMSSETRGTCPGMTIRSGLSSAGWLFQKPALPARLCFGAGRGCVDSKQRPMIHRWSWRFRPTPGRSMTVSMPSGSRSAWGPTPDSKRRRGVWIAPAHRITSRDAPTEHSLPSSRNSTPVQRIPESLNLRAGASVLTEAPALKLRLSGMRCTGVEFLLDGKLCSVGASREVILCAGAIHTPRLLLLSGVGPHADLEPLGIDTVIDLPGVGRNLQDHLWIMGLCFEAKHALPAPNYNLAGSAGFWKSRPALDRPDLMVMPGQGPLVSDEIAARYPIPPNASVILPCLVRPQSRGYLRLRTADPDGPLEIQPNFLAAQADVEALAAAIELGLDLASQRAYRDLIKRWVVPPERMSRVDAVAFVRRSCSSYLHPVGTCAMGRDREAVVGVELRVHGIEGLRV